MCDPRATATTIPATATTPDATSRLRTSQHPRTSDLARRTLGEDKLLPVPMSPAAAAAGPAINTIEDR
jgi:hypothetical protein